MAFTITTMTAALLASLAFGPQNTFLAAIVAAITGSVVSTHTVQWQAEERYRLDVKTTQLGEEGVLGEVGNFVYIVYQSIGLLKTLGCCSHQFPEVD